MVEKVATKDLGVTVKKSENFSEWYIQVILKSELADYAAVKGAIVLRPYGYAIWDRIRRYFDAQLRRRGHLNAYFPLLIPESLLAREAEHFKGFTPEVFWVTHAGDSELGERLAIRPTSETIAYASYARWIKSWRDLPLLLNFWNSVLRAEIKMTKPFIRTSEFLWQEGHTAHATREEAEAEAREMLRVYERLMRNLLAIPVLRGYKSEKEKFVGAVYTLTLEAIMPDGRALQMGTSHMLGQNFSKPFEISYLGKDGKEHYVWQTCWGISWRLIGAMVMIHGDDKGLIIPPRVAPIQAVIVPIYYSEKDRTLVWESAQQVLKVLRAAKVQAHFDSREEYTPGWKYNEWELKGVPLRIEIGPRDVREGKVILVKRTGGPKEPVPVQEVASTVRQRLREVQAELYRRAEALLNRMMHEAQSLEELRSIIESRGGFVRAPWCGSRECEDIVKEKAGADIRLIPLEPERPTAPCVACGGTPKHTAYFAKAY
jgi:prolyl-tRNA synthetase